MGGMVKRTPVSWSTANNEKEEAIDTALKSAGNCAEWNEDVSNIYNYNATYKILKRQNYRNAEHNPCVRG